MTPNSKKKFEDLLPDDGELFARSKVWGNFFQKFSQEKKEDLAISMDEIPDDSDDDNESQSRDDESIPVSEFEDKNHNDDPNFNVQDVLSKTMKVVARRRENWHKTGIDHLMDSFCMQQYTDKVDDWLKKNTDYFSKGFNRGERCCGGAVPCIDEVQIRDHQVYVENGSDQDSLQSVATAKYILSNRKKQRTRVRTMTIKRYCFSRKRMEELERDQRERTENTYDILNDRYSVLDRIPHKRKSVPKTNESRPFIRSQQCYTEHKRKPRKRNRRSSPSASSESSFRSESKNVYAGRYSHNIRQKKRNKLRPLKEKCSSLSSTIESSKSRGFLPRKNRMYRLEYSPSKTGSNITDSIIKFCPQNIVNSTELSTTAFTSEQKGLPNIGECISISSEDGLSGNISPSSISKKVSIGRPKSENSTPIVIYHPEDNSRSLNKSIVNGKIVIDSKTLEETIGPEFAKIYLGEKKHFSQSFDLQSKIVFYPPDQNTQTSDSEVDILETMSSNTRGCIIVQKV